MLIILLLFAPENDGGINCESEDIYERVQSNFFAVMARAVNFKRRPKGVCLHAAANNNGKKYTARTLARIVNISVAADRRKDKIIQKGLVHHQHTGFWPLHVASCTWRASSHRTGPSSKRVVCAYRSARAECKCPDD